MLALILTFAVAVAELLTTAPIMAADFSFEPTWQPPRYDAVRAEVRAWLRQNKGSFAPSAAEKVDELWAPTPPDDGASILDRLAQTFAAAYPQAEDLLAGLDDSRGVSAPAVEWLQDAELPALVRNNLQLYLGRWHAQHALYDEAIDSLTGLSPRDVVDPAALLFYRMVANQQLVRPDDARSDLVQLLERRRVLPRRYLQVAELLERDLAGLEDESLDHIARRMKDIRRRLDYGRAGERVQAIEKGVVDSLDKKIDDLEKQQQQQQQSMSSGGAAPLSPMQDSYLPQIKAPMQVDQKDIGNRAGWGNLPPKEREQALQQLGQDFPAHYRDVIEQYFRELANEPTQSR